ncbi:MAG: hypothetical protein P8168_13355 [Deltaproteobacteria bacterium]|jgi:hypothetical protein
MHNQDRGAPKFKRCLALGVALLWLAGCYPPSALEQDYGNSVRNNIAQQVVNPRAGLDSKPAVGLPPQAAVNEMTTYDNSFKAKPQKVFQGMQVTY